MPELTAGLTPPPAAADLATGLALLSAGVATWLRASRSGTGPLLALAGVVWLAGDAWSTLAYAHRGPLVHALLTYPTGRTRSPALLGVIALAYVDGLASDLARAPWPTIALMTLVVGAATWRYALSRGLERRRRIVPLVGAIAMAGPLVLAAVGNLADAGTDAVAGWGYDAAIALTAVALAADLISGRSVRAAATGLVIDLGANQEPQALRSALAHTVGDPQLLIAYRVDEQWVDEAGRTVSLPAGGGARVVTVVEDGSLPIAALLHDPAALRDETLARSVEAAVRLALANVRLSADVAARVREVEASRRRLVEAGDEQRRRLRDELRGGAEEGLAVVASGLEETAVGRKAETAAVLADLLAELDAARADLVRFAQGLHPRSLTEGGLRSALVELADQAACPVVLDATARRFPGAQEAAAYFVCSEGLANVAKYADASRAWIDVEAAGSRLIVRVADDGRGGADPTRGSGLRGLADRIEARGGALSVESPPSAGTRLVASLPISGDPAP